ncbi:hypothetical protein AZE42_13571 [Rhizopogon vesiculosus]|uniref:Uncharacterized protein n=1 Tax=Rhizopogon vesiculosus TaxID=180088 RepID=A0A1J8QBS9_9AGAM|nr:hypothetical protein AZE42_13571 [Rhizopogon vesiculosus]
MVLTDEFRIILIPHALWFNFINASMK